MHKLSNQSVNWDAVDTVLLDMDGTLLDLHFDSYFWLQVIPGAYADSVGKTLAEVADGLRAVFERKRGTLDWYAIDFWTRELAMDVMALQRQNASRIAYLAGTVDFLRAIRAAGKRCMLVTNADRQTLALKHEHTGVGDWFEEVVSSHDFGKPKEHAGFWPEFVKKYDVMANRAVFFDDTVTVLDAAHRFGVGQVVAIAMPDSQAPRRPPTAHITIDGVRDLIAPA